MTSPSQVLFLQRKAEPEDRIIRSPLDDDANPSRDSLRAVIAKPTADPLLVLMSRTMTFSRPNCDSAKRHISSYGGRRTLSDVPVACRAAQYRFP
jgi:hypothetical protein